MAWKNLYQIDVLRLLRYCSKILLTLISMTPNDIQSIHLQCSGIIPEGDLNSSQKNNLPSPQLPIPSYHNHTFLCLLQCHKKWIFASRMAFQVMFMVNTSKCLFRELCHVILRGKGHGGLYSVSTKEERRKQKAKRRKRSDQVYWSWIWKMAGCKIQESKGRQDVP